MSPTRSFDDKLIPVRCCGTPLSTSTYASGICEYKQGYSQTRDTDVSASGYDYIHPERCEWVAKVREEEAPYHPKRFL